ncbi:hypothetical protein [Candidatus Poriferisodalis sp.]|uniref:hypothetical protein n=1 Tax=Candidatus Poriferisodalis sp. TaxID=3101277 RepID=UPI003B02C480
MAETLALAAGVPAALGAAWWASRRSWSPAHADSRGIALQTVIVIVVMLVIAGGVAGVLLSRGSDVISDLESQDVGSITADNCTTIRNGVLGVLGGTESCQWTGTSSNPVSSTACTVAGGTFTVAGTAVTAGDSSLAVGASSNVGGVCRVVF